MIPYDTFSISGDDSLANAQSRSSLRLMPHTLLGHDISDAEKNKLGDATQNDRHTVEDA